MLGRRRRRRADIKTILGQHIVFAEVAVKAVADPEGGGAAPLVPPPPPFNVPKTKKRSICLL